MSSIEKPPRSSRTHRRSEETQMTRDPVCGMEVGSYRSYAFTYQGREYGFCSLSCVEKFKAEPEKYGASGSED